MPNNHYYRFLQNFKSEPKSEHRAERASEPLLYKGIVIDSLSFSLSRNKIFKQLRKDSSSVSGSFLPVRHALVVLATELKLLRVRASSAGTIYLQK